jgi:hypothetical protein
VSLSDAMPQGFTGAVGVALDRVCSWSGQSWQVQNAANRPNLVFVFMQKWDELSNLAMDFGGPLAIQRLIGGLTAGNLTQFRRFSYAEDGSLASAIGFYNMDSRLRDYPAERLALAQALLTHANFAPGALNAPVVEFDGAAWNPSQKITQILQTAYADETPVALHGEDGASRLYDCYARLARATQGTAP